MLSRPTSSTRLAAAVVAVVMLLHVPTTAFAQACTAEQLDAAVDQAGAKLREITQANQPKIEARVTALKAKRGWTDAEAEERALESIADKRIEALDTTANELLARLDTLGALPAGAVPECGRIQDLEASSLELQAAVRTKSAYVLARLDALIAGAPPAADSTPAPPARVAAVPTPPAPPVPTSPPAAKPPAAPEAAPWSTTTTVEAQAPAPAAQPAPPPTEEGFTREEIMRASTGFFGQVSAGIATVVERTFSATGRPTGYILGSEGGGAFLAGLRYGSGTLVLRSGLSMPVHWHGPSLGADIGAAGSKVMFLVYRLTEAEQLFPAFTSIEGSAYVAGGVGVTLMSNGRVQMAPIRAGVGLRLGASVGYVRFTRRPTWNPF